MEISNTSLNHWEIGDIVKVNWESEDKILNKFLKKGTKLRIINKNYYNVGVETLDGEIHTNGKCPFHWNIFKGAY